MANGLALSKIRAYQAGFLIFSDFQRGALRLSALMELPVIHIYTHDSIGVGEDGPTHQPIEHLASIRAMPGLIDLRPGDANEVVEAWKVIMPLRHDPVALILSRQAMPTLDRTKYAAASGVARGGYVLAGHPDATPEVILIASGTEVGLAVEAYEQLVGSGVDARVVSMASMELFDRQPKEYRASVLPPAVTARVVIEQGTAFGLDRWAGSTGAIVAMSTFGASAPLKALQAKFGFTVERVVELAREQIAGDGRAERHHQRSELAGAAAFRRDPLDQRREPGRGGRGWRPGHRGHRRPTRRATWARAGRSRPASTSARARPPTWP